MKQECHLSDVVTGQPYAFDVLTPWIPVALLHKGQHWRWEQQVVTTQGSDREGAPPATLRPSTADAQTLGSLF